MKKGCTTSSSMQSVFDNVLLKFSSSLDIFSAKMASNKFKEIVEDPCIYQHINITDFETVNPLRS
ncbi:hypothetical protein DVH24_039005 [Malus domestica]|uniref:F-box domain-containing protein n=1 Tax=Malus domestica TaxID=3750 RepID=A0A498KBD2_MALDO|nr:hypothetical protein DVH24_039005 [Malus domestica]